MGTNVGDEVGNKVGTKVGIPVGNEDGWDDADKSQVFVTSKASNVVANALLNASVSGASFAITIPVQKQTRSQDHNAIDFMFKFVLHELVGGCRFFYLNRDIPLRKPVGVYYFCWCCQRPNDLGNEPEKNDRYCTFPILTSSQGLCFGFSQTPLQN